MAEYLETSYKHKRIGRPKINVGNCMECDSPSKVRGYCNVHYSRALKKGRIVPVARPIEKHPIRPLREYSAWLSMKARCSNTNLPNYKNYGGRGITVCERWMYSFNNFLTDMGMKPETYNVRYTLERRDVNGNYEPRNCYWATYTDQARNKRVKANSLSGVRGIQWNKRENRWKVTIKVNYTGFNIGTFRRLDEAIKARKEAEKTYYERTS